jgi:hypothetical protein
MNNEYELKDWKSGIMESLALGLGLGSRMIWEMGVGR